MRATVTSESLLVGLLDEQDAAWHGYVERFRPVLLGYARRLGVPGSDVEDLAQDTLLAFARACREGRYDPAQGRLRSWLFGFARNHVLAWRRRRGRPSSEQQVVDSGEHTGFFAALPNGEDPDEQWEKEWREAVLRQCLREVQTEVGPVTWRAFLQFAQEGRAAREVAAANDMTENAVFLAKRRVLHRLRELRPAIEEAFG